MTLLLAGVNRSWNEKTTPKRFFGREVAVPKKLHRTHRSGRYEVIAHLVSMVVALIAVGVCLWRVGEVNTLICTVCTVGTAFLTLVPIKNTPLSFFEKFTNVRRIQRITNLKSLRPNHSSKKA